MPGQPPTTPAPARTASDQRAGMHGGALCVLRLIRSSRRVQGPLPGTGRGWHLTRTLSTPVRWFPAAGFTAVRRDTATMPTSPPTSRGTASRRCRTGAVERAGGWSGRPITTEAQPAASRRHEAGPTPRRLSAHPSVVRPGGACSAGRCTHEPPPVGRSVQRRLHAYPVPHSGACRSPVGRTEGPGWPERVMLGHGLAE